MTKYDDLPGWPKGVTPALSGERIQEILEGKNPLPPWPIVGECFSDHRPGHSCPQCDGSCEHSWRAWHEAPQADPYSPGTTVTAGSSGPGIPVRCRVCGARKCDASVCMLRRHHRGPHENY